MSTLTMDRRLAAALIRLLARGGAAGDGRRRGADGDGRYLGCRPDGAICRDASEEIAIRLAEPAAFTRLIDERVIEHALVIAAHDHLQRGIRRREWWADRLAPPQPAERPPG